MAKSGSLNSSNYDGRYIQFNWTATQSIVDNTSTISWTLKGAGGNNGYYHARNIKVTIDGSTVYSQGQGTASNYILLYDGTVVASGKKTLTHKADRSRTFTVTIEAGIYVWAVNCTGSTTFTLDTIPGPSTFTVSNTSLDMGTAVTFNINRAATAFTHKLTYSFEGKTGEIGSNIATSKTWTIPLSLATAIPNNTSGTATITLTTYQGSTVIGSKSLTMTLKVPTSVVPTISGVAITEATSDLSAKFGAFVQNKSTLKVVITATGVQGSTIKSYSTEILGKTYIGDTFTSNVLTVSGSIYVNVTVTDSRGRTNTSTEIVEVLTYKDPKITAFTVARCDSDGTLNDDGEYVTVSIAFDIASIDDKNDKSYTVAYKVKDDADFTTLIGGSVYSLNTTYIPSVTFTGDNSYDFILTVTDYFKPVSHIGEIPTAFTLVDYHSSGTGMGIGKVAEKSNTLEIALDVEFIGKVRGTIFDAIYPVGSIYLAFNHINPANLFGGTWERIENAFLWASAASDTIGVTGGEKTHTLTVNEMPTHKHQVAAYKSTDGNGAPVDAYSALAGSSTGSDTTSKYYTNGTQSVGGSQPHNNMPPYIQVSAWRRTA
jgi:hypothetical protein